MRTAVYTGNRKVYRDMDAACKSLLYHGAADWVLFLIEDDAFPDEDLPENVHCMNVSDQAWFRKDGPNYHNYWSYFTMMKAAVPFIVPGRVLVLDVDTIVCDDLSGLWSLPDAPIYMALEAGKPDYYNSGVILMDASDPSLQADMREVIRRLNEKHYDFNEQDAISEVMAGRIAKLPSEYNVCPWTVKPESGRTSIEHYAGLRYWRDRELWRKYDRMTWDEVLRH